MFMDENEQDRIFESSPSNYLESLRPQKLINFIGQNHLKRNIELIIQATRARNDPLDHLLFYGPPGLGKTTLARIISNELNVNVRTTSGPAIERTGDLASILTNLEDFDILFIDEIHRLSKVVEETLYPAMEDYAIDIVIGKGPSAQTLRLDLPKFTLIGATTRLGLLSAPMRDRFGAIYRIDFYQEEELSAIIHRSAQVIEVDIDDAAAKIIAQRSRGTPRIANRLLKRVRDYAQIHNRGRINNRIVEQACELLKIDQFGLNDIDFQYLHMLVTKYQGGPVGLDTIAAAIAEDKGSIEDVIEPFLLQQGLIKKTPRGRIATDFAIDLLTQQKENRLF